MPSISPTLNARCLLLVNEDVSTLRDIWPLWRGRSSLDEGQSALVASLDQYHGVVTSLDETEVGRLKFMI